MKTLLTAVCFLPIAALAQPHLQTVKTIIIGDSDHDVEEVSTFGFNAVVTVANMDPGCTATFNYDGPAQTMVMSMGEKGSLTVGTSAKNAKGEDFNVSPVIGVTPPVIFWTDVRNVKCSCTKGAHIQIMEMKRVGVR